METVRMANMCMIYDNGKVVVQERTIREKTGFTFPGGKVEPGESIVDSVIREVKEETNLDIDNLEYCGIKNWYDVENDYRYIVFVYKTSSYKGTLTSSDEGEVDWIELDKLNDDNTVFQLMDTMKLFLDNDTSELFYDKDGKEWSCIYK